LSGDERIRDHYLGGGEHGDAMTFGDRPLNVDTRRLPASLAGHGKAFCFHRRSGPSPIWIGDVLIPPSI
jgi:hypothetical protein